MRLKSPSIHQRVRVAPAALTATVGGEVVRALIEIPKPKSQIPNPKKSQTRDLGASCRYCGECWCFFVRQLHRLVRLDGEIGGPVDKHHEARMLGGDERLLPRRDAFEEVHRFGLHRS